MIHFLTVYHCILIVVLLFQLHHYYVNTVQYSTAQLHKCTIPCTGKWTAKNIWFELITWLFNFLKLKLGVFSKLTRKITNGDQWTKQDLCWTLFFASLQTRILGRRLVVGCRINDGQLCCSARVMLLNWRRRLPPLQQCIIYYY